MNEYFPQTSLMYMQDLGIEKREKRKEKNKSKEEIKNHIGRGRKKILVLKAFEGKEGGDVAE